MLLQATERWPRILAHSVISLNLINWWLYLNLVIYERIRKSKRFAEHIVTPMNSQIMIRHTYSTLVEYKSSLTNSILACIICDVKFTATIYHREWNWFEIPRIRPIKDNRVSNFKWLEWYKRWKAYERNKKRTTIHHGNVCK
jgi:hypothetical protein